MSVEHEVKQLWKDVAGAIQSRRWSATAVLNVLGALFIDMCERCNEDPASVLTEIKQAKDSHDPEALN